MSGDTMERHARTLEDALRQRDVLEAKMAEHTRALHAVKNGLRTLLEITPVGLALITLPDHGLLFANARCLELLEAQPDAPLGPHVAEVWVNADDRARFVAACGVGIRGMEAELRTRGGHNFWARVAAAPLTWNDAPAVLVSIDDISVQKRAEMQLRELATRDVLTGIHNRRNLSELGAHELDRARRYQRPFSAAMIDIDHFKCVNDDHGHAVGDDVLRAVVRIVADLLRGSDLLGRWGGEEFVVLLPETDLGAATRVLERVRVAVAERALSAGPLEIKTSISIGVAEWTGIESLASLVERADQACYAAKRAGRNRIDQALPR
jgi:diguanylate cyclase (GGDEF)-like protein/PAS domain S-box-containing protein